MFIVEETGSPANNLATIVVDTTPDFRYQCLRAGIERVDAVVYTHYHADHIFGLDDLRSYNFTQKSSIPLFANSETAQDIRQRFNYVFNVQDRSRWSTPPELSLSEIEPFTPFTICGIRILPLTVGHGDLDILGFKVGNFAYLTDCNFIPEETVHHLSGIDTIILDALRHRPHGAHFTVEESVQQLERIKPRKAYLTHLSHELDYEETNRFLKEKSNIDVELAYDTMEVELHGTPLLE